MCCKRPFQEKESLFHSFVVAEWHRAGRSPRFSSRRSSPDRSPCAWRHHRVAPSRSCHAAPPLHLTVPMRWCLWCNNRDAAPPVGGAPLRLTWQQLRRCKRHSLQSCFSPYYTRSCQICLKTVEMTLRCPCGCVACVYFAQTARERHCQSDERLRCHMHTMSKRPFIPPSALCCNKPAA